MNASRGLFCARSLLRAVLLCTAAISTLSCSAQTGNASDEPTSTASEALAAGTITISGSVADAQFPQAGITITLSGSAQQQVVTDFSGAYSFTVKAGGSYSLTARGTDNFFAPPFQSCLTITPDVVNLNDLKTDTTVNFVGAGNNVVTNCAPAEVMGATVGSLTVSGVVSSAGSPVPGVLVSLNGGAQGFRVTDEAGAYSFAVNAGTYSVNISGPCASFTPSVVNLNGIQTSRVANFDGVSCPPAPLQLCPTLDSAFGLSEPASCAVSSSRVCAAGRNATWANTIQNDWFDINTADCRFGQWNNSPIVDLFTSLGLFQDGEFLNLYALQLFGCALAGNLDGPLGFPFILTDLQSLKFTTADLDALSDEYVQAVVQALADAGAPPLSAAQISALRAQLASAASRVKGVTQSSQLSFSTCTP